LFHFRDGSLRLPNRVAHVAFLFACCKLRTNFERAVSIALSAPFPPSVFNGSDLAEVGRWVHSPTMFTSAKSTIRNTFKQLKANAVGGQI
jgi:hypothetical protein